MSSEQPKEYIIPANRFSELDAYFALARNDITRIAWANMCKDIRPHPAPDCEDIMSTGYEQGVKDGARKAREEVLDNIWKFICAYQQTGFDGFPSVKVVNLQVHLESLRSTQHTGQQQQQPKEVRR